MKTNKHRTCNNGYSRQIRKADVHLTKANFRKCLFLVLCLLKLNMLPIPIISQNNVIRGL